MNDIKQKLYKLKKDKRFLLIMGAGVLGMLLICFSSFGNNTVKKTEENYYSLCCKIEAELQKRITDLLKNTSGVGDAEVVITLDSLEERILAEDFSTDGEKSQSSFVISEQGGDENGVVLKLVMPQVRGVAVSCEGGASDKIKLEVTMLVTAALGIPSNRVFVSELIKNK